MTAPTVLWLLEIATRTCPTATPSGMSIFGWINERTRMSGNGGDDANGLGGVTEMKGSMQKFVWGGLMTSLQAGV